MPTSKNNVKILNKKLSCLTIRNDFDVDLKEGVFMSEVRQEDKLIRNLGFWDLMAIAVGQIVGAGIMSSTGVAIGMTGTGVVLAYLFSPVLTIISIFRLQS